MTRELRQAVALSVALHAVCLCAFRGNLFDTGALEGQEEAEAITVVGTVELPQREAAKPHPAPPKPPPPRPVPAQTPPARPTDIARQKPVGPSISRPERDISGKAPEYRPQLPRCQRPRTEQFSPPAASAPRLEKKQNPEDRHLAAQLTREREKAAQDYRPQQKDKQKQARQQQAPSTNQQPGARQTKRGARLDARSKYLTDVLARLQRAKRYPWKAQRRTIEGTAEVAFTISENGQISSLRLARSSGSRVLDRAARDTVKEAAPFAPFPADLEQRRLRVAVPVVFRFKDWR